MLPIVPDFVSKAAKRAFAIIGLARFRRSLDRLALLLTSAGDTPITVNELRVTESESFRTVEHIRSVFFSFRYLPSGHLSFILNFCVQLGTLLSSLHQLAVPPSGHNDYMALIARWEITAHNNLLSYVMADVEALIRALKGTGPMTSRLSSV